MSDLFCRYSSELIGAIKEVDQAEFDKATSILVEAWKKDRQVFIAGNGGSAGSANHFVCDFGKNAVNHGMRRFRIHSLCDNPEVITALGNDIAFDQIFAFQLESQVREGDVLIVISASGNSSDLVNACEVAKSKKASVIALSGFGGGKICRGADACFITDMKSYERIEDLHMMILHMIVCWFKENQDKLSWNVEIVKPWNKADYDIKYALFDFDGTVSLIRQGWQGIMIPYFTEVLLATGTKETPEEIYELVRLFVTDLTGKQTIFQCIRLAEEVTARGGTPLEPIEYKREYLRRLEERIRERKAALTAGTVDPDEWIVPGAKAFVSKLRERGIKCYLASGTDDKDVLHEAGLLGLDAYFDGGIWGARDDLAIGRRKEDIKEIKAEVIRDMIERQKIQPRELVSFGDGFVEVELVANLGGLAIGAATNEAERKGIDSWKRSRLIVAGAKAIIPDFSDPDKIIETVL